MGWGDYCEIRKALYAIEHLFTNPLFHSFTEQNRSQLLTLVGRAFKGWVDRILGREEKLGGREPERLMKCPDKRK